jgi:hypothetical protein
MITVMIEPDDWLTKARQESRLLVIAAGLSGDDIDRLIKQAQKVRHRSASTPESRLFEPFGQIRGVPLWAALYAPVTLFYRKNCLVRSRGLPARRQHLG